MSITRRDWMKLSATAALGALVPAGLSGSDDKKIMLPDYEKNLFNFTGQISDPVIVKKIELLKKGNSYFVRTSCENAVTGLIRTKQITHFISIFKNLVAPHFLGSDARDLETLIDKVYTKNYKLAGQSLWCPLAYIEQSLLDLLGRTVGKSVGTLFGGVVRKEIPVYLSGSGRNTTAEEEVDIYVQGVEETGAGAVKFKIGGRMSRNLDAYPGRTDALLTLARKKLGDDIILYADANGSYDAKEAIRMGRFLEELNFSFFEEPCPWQEYSETQKVTQELNIPVACGEQDSSLWQFQWMMDNKVMDIVQPDLNYNGGLIRGTRVARMAKGLGMNITPHNTQTGGSSGNILQFASSIPNIGPFMEYPWRNHQKPESWYSPNFIVKYGMLQVPDGPGMGINIDPGYLSGAEIVASIAK